MTKKRERERERAQDREKERRENEFNRNVCVRERFSIIRTVNIRVHFDVMSWCDGILHVFNWIHAYCLSCSHKTFIKLESFSFDCAVRMRTRECPYMRETNPKERSKFFCSKKCHSYRSALVISVIVWVKGSHFESIILAKYICM